MSANRYTQGQILCGLRILWSEQSLDSSFEPDTRIDHQLKVDEIWDEIDLACFAKTLEEFFGFSCPREEWERFFGWSIADPDVWEREVGPRLTFGRLADFIRERLELIPLEPLTLLGKPCLTAGVFRGLEQLAERINPKVARFAPSTSIRARLQGVHLRRFWSRLRWMLEDQLPPPPQITLISRGFRHSLIAKLALGLLVALWRRDLTGLLEGIGVTFALLIPVGVIVAFINEHLNPLPKGIETFGDLARYLAVITVDQQPECA